MEPILIQLDLFQEMSEMDRLRLEVRELRESQDKVRKSLFAKHGDLAKKYLECHFMLDDLKLQIDRMRNEKKA